jgi:hypothetical protein
LTVSSAYRFLELFISEETVNPSHKLSSTTQQTDNQKRDTLRKEILMTKYYTLKSGNIRITHMRKIKCATPYEKIMITKWKKMFSIAYDFQINKKIAVCDDWYDFRIFLKDIQSNYNENASFRRIDISKEYSKCNFYWAA